jgi:regulator of sigma E protease
MNLVSIIVFILVFGVVVSVHEFGHFIIAKKFGVVVYEFAIGMGPKIFGVLKNGTNFVLRIIPIGGYVSIAGDSSNDGIEELRTGRIAKITLDSDNKVKTIDISDTTVKQNELVYRISKIDLNNDLIFIGLDDNQNEFKYSILDQAIIKLDANRKIMIAPENKRITKIAVWKQVVVNLAGPIMNFILSAILFFVLAFAMPKVPTNDLKISVVDNTPAQVAGLKNGTKILAVDNKKVANWNQLTSLLASDSDHKVKIQYQDLDKKIKNTNVLLKKDAESKRYLLGINQYLSNNFNDRINYSYSSFINAATSIWKAIGQLIIHPSVDKLGGPVAIAKVTNQATKQGFWTVLSLIAFLSLNIGTFNLIPIPVLDGGKVLLNIIQLFRKKPLSTKTDMIVSGIGVAIMVLIFIFVTINDISR